MMLQAIKDALREEARKLDRLYRRHGFFSDHPDIPPQHEVVHELRLLAEWLENRR